MSEIAWKKTEKVEDVLKVGDEVDVKLLEIDPKTGKMRLSMRALQEKPEGYVEPERRPRPDRGPRRDDARKGGERGGDRGPRREGGRDERRPRHEDRPRGSHRDERPRNEEPRFDAPAEPKEDEVF